VEIIDMKYKVSEEEHFDVACACFLCVFGR